MQTKTIYVYLGENGTSGVQTPFKLAGAAENKTFTRLIADECKELINGDVRTTCIDVENDAVVNWTEEDAVIVTEIKEAEAE